MLLSARSGSRIIDWKALAADFPHRNSHSYVISNLSGASLTFDTSYGAVLLARKKRLFEDFEGAGLLLFSDKQTKKT